MGNSHNHSVVVVVIVVDVVGCDSFCAVLAELRGYARECMWCCAAKSDCRRSWDALPGVRGMESGAYPFLAPGFRILPKLN